jgi:hypothetical protein
MGRTTEADAVLEIIKKVDEVCKSRGKRYDDRMIKHYITMGSIIKYWPAQLFIFFEESKIYAYKRIPLLLNTIFSSQNVDEENIENKNKSIEILIEEYSESKKYRPINKTEISKIKKDMVKYINKNKEKNVKLCGQRLNELIYEKTKLKEELQNDNDKIKNVVICCKDEDIDYVWEWIYWKEKKFFRGDKFFWGDKFNIVRIPKDGIPDRELKNSNLQIKKFATVSDTACNCNCTTDVIKYFDNLIGPEKYKKIKLQELNSENLNAIDCIHFVANIETFRNKTSLISDCVNRLNGQNTSNSNSANTQLKFLFSNIRVPTSSTLEKKGGNLSKLKDILARAAEICIDTTFDPPNDSEIYFVNYFYGAFQSEKNVVDAAAVARRRIGSKKLWRLAYVVRGNPCTEVTWKVAIAALGTPEQEE